MRFALAGLLIVAASAHAQLAQPTPAAVFYSARDRLLADMQRQPRYICRQNITRQTLRASSGEKCSAMIAAVDRRKHNPRITSWDRLRLDVGIADNREIHAWPDASRFSEDEVRRLLGTGPFGTGDFASFLTAIFGGAAKIGVQGQHVHEGRTLFDYTYEVPVQASHYKVETQPAPVITAYSGSFVLDPQTSDIVELIVRTAELTANTGMCQAQSEIEYSRMNIRGREVLIPQETRLRIMNRTGKEKLNTILYSSCQEYTSKSVLRFDNPKTSPGISTPPPQQAMLNPPPSPFPEGLTFNCRIVTPLDSDTAAAGSSMEAILRTPLRGKNGVILAPAGARIRARLIRFAQYKQEVDYFEVGVRLESIVINGGEQPLYAILNQPTAIPVTTTIPPDTSPLSYIPQRPSLPQIPDLPPPLPSDVGIFFFMRGHLQLDQFDSSWVTASPKPRKKSQPAVPAMADKTHHSPAEVAVANMDKVQTSEIPAQSAEAVVPEPVVSTSVPQNPVPTAADAEELHVRANLPMKAQAEKPQSTFPSGTTIPAALSKSLDAKKNKVGDKVEAKTTWDLFLPGQIALRRDTKIEGHVSNARANSKTLPGSMIEIAFDDILTEDGRKLPLQATLRAVWRVQIPGEPTNEPVIRPRSSSPRGLGEADSPPQAPIPDAEEELKGKLNTDALRGNIRGVFGFEGLSLNDSAQGSVISSEKENVHLNSGTQLILRTR